MSKMSSYTCNVLSRMSNPAMTIHYAAIIIIIIIVRTMFSVMLSISDLSFVLCCRNGLWLCTNRTRTIVI